MKPQRRRLQIPQFEFSFVPGIFGLIQESGLDGERLVRERAQAEKARKVAEAAQAKLFARRSPKRHTRLA